MDADPLIYGSKLSVSGPPCQGARTALSNNGNCCYVCAWLFLELVARYPMTSLAGTIGFSPFFLFLSLWRFLIYLGDALILKSPQDRRSMVDPPSISVKFRRAICGLPFSICLSVSLPPFSTSY